jgi:hypothetical protein
MFLDSIHRDSALPPCLSINFGRAIRIIGYELSFVVISSGYATIMLHPLQ